MMFFGLKGPPPNSPNSSMKPLVDLTETSPTKNDNIDVDLEKVNSKKLTKHKKWLLSNKFS